MNATYQSTVKYFSTGISLTFHIIILFLFFAYGTYQFFSQPHTLPEPDSAQATPGRQEPAPVVFENEPPPAPAQEKIVEQETTSEEPQEPVAIPAISDLPEQLSKPLQRRSTARSRWHKKNIQEQPPQEPTVGARLNQSFNQYLQKQYSENTTQKAQTYSSDFEQDIYLKKLFKALVDATRIYSKTAHCDQDVFIKVQAMLDIDSSGKLSNITLSRSTGNMDIDSAMKELCYAAHFPPLPANLKEKAPLQYPVTFNLRQRKGFTTIIFTPESVF